MAIVNPIKKKTDPYQEHEVELLELRTEQSEARREQEKSQDELIHLLAQQRRNENERSPLVGEHKKALAAVLESKDALSRHLSKPTEHIYTEKHQDAEEKLQTAAQALTAYDAQCDREAMHKRALALRESLQKTEQALHTLQERETELARGQEKVRTFRATAAQIRIVSAVQDLITVLEHDGLALAKMRDDNPAGFTRLMEDIELTQTDLYEMVIPCIGPMGELDYRPLIALRQQAVAERLKKLAKK